jgi:hypothetical protein
MSSDNFGTRKIYPDKGGSDGHIWHFNGSNFSGETAQRGSDESGDYYTINSSQVRASAHTKYGYKSNEIKIDMEDVDENLGGNGHMQGSDPTWRDVEMTGYFMGRNSGDTEFVPYCRGGTHSGHDQRGKCEGQAYKCAFDYSNGQTRFRKEQWHNSGYVSGSWRSAYGGSTTNRWVGAKFIVYNVGTKPNINVKLEAWVDRDNNNNWVKVNDFTDTGSWGNDSPCGGPRSQKLTWSGPKATFRWDVSGLRFKKLSVREIAPAGGTSPPPGPPSPTPPPPPPPGLPPPPPPGGELGDRFVYPNEAVSASSSLTSNPVSNINDQIGNTLWVTNTLPAWVNIDLLAKKKVMYVSTVWAAHPSVTQTVSFNVETSLDNVTFTRQHDGTVTIPAGVPPTTNTDFIDHNARFVRVNILANSAGNLIGIAEFMVFGDHTPIGEEPPAPPPPPGTPPPPGVPPPPPAQGDPEYVYAESKHVFHVNFQSATTQADDTDLCAPDIPLAGTGPAEVEGPDIFTVPPPSPGLPPPPPSPTPPPVETIAPSVVSTTPPNGVTGIAIAQTILVEMSEAMLSSSINSSTITISPSVTAAFSLTGTDSNIINIDPSANLANETSYTITVKGGSTGVKDLVGNALPSNHVFSFTTIVAPDTTAPTIISKTPDNGTTGVARDANITITFSEPMMTSRVTDGEIDLWRTSDGLNIPRSVTLNAAKTVATVNPNSDLGGGTQYTVRVRGGVVPSVADAAGNAMADPDVQWSFTTVAPTYTLKYDLSASGTSWIAIDHNPYKKRGLRLDSDSTSGTPTNNAPLINVRPKRVEVLMYRVGSPGGTTSVKIMRETGSDEPLTHIATIGTMNSNDITTSTSGAWYTFTNDALEHPLEIDDCIVVETSAGTTSNHILHRRSDTSVWDKGVTIRGYDDGSDQDSSRDFICKIYE